MLNTLAAVFALTAILEAVIIELCKALYNAQIKKRRLIDEERFLFYYKRVPEFRKGKHDEKRFGFCM